MLVILGNDLSAGIINIKLIENFAKVFMVIMENGGAGSRPENGVLKPQLYRICSNDCDKFLPLVSISSQVLTRKDII